MIGVWEFNTRACGKVWGGVRAGKGGGPMFSVVFISQWLLLGVGVAVSNVSPLLVTCQIICGGEGGGGVVCLTDLVAYENEGGACQKKRSFYFPRCLQIHKY